METHIYTDGGCIGNPGPGAWAYVIEMPEGNEEDSGFENPTTNNRMELMAVISALGRVRDLKGHEWVIHTDSQYVQKGISQWIISWKRNGWKTASKQAVKNQDLWQRLDSLNATVKPQWRWVKGHAGIELNERCDDLVQACIRTHGF